MSRSALVRGRVAAVVAVLGALALFRRGSRVHPDLRVHAALLPREPITPRTLPLIRALTRWTDGFRARARGFHDRNHQEAGGSGR
ncbi:hypothetical protein ACWEKT_05285 [Nocardia takedensis]